MKLRKVIIWSFLSLLTLIIAIAVSLFEFNHTKIAIALVAPLTDVSPTIAVNGNYMVDGAQLYIDQINQAGGINGHKLVLQVYDDHNDPQIAGKIAHEIVSSKALAVIGHYSSNASLVAGKIYQAYGIPAVTGSATADEVTKWNPYYFRTTLINSQQGMFMANYIYQIVKRSRISIIYSPDSYGLTLAKDFETAFIELGGEIVNRWTLEEETDRASIVQNLVSLKKRGEDPGAIFMAAGLDASASLIAKMRLYNLDYAIFGGDNLGDVSLARRFANTPEERDKPGFFTNNIYALTPIVFDISGETGQEFRNMFEERFGQPPGTRAASYYDAAHAIVAALEESLNNEEQLLQKAVTQQNWGKARYLVKKALANLQPIDTAIQTLAEDKYFNNKGDIYAPLVIVRYYRGLQVAAFTQLQAIPNEKMIDNLEEKLQLENIIKFGSEYMMKTDIVYTGIDINRVTNLNEKTSTYLIDFYLWFLYENNNFKPEEIEFSNFGVERLDSGEKLTLEEPIEKATLQKGVNYQLYRVQADFKEEFNFRDYPFDRQTLAIRFRHSNLTRDKLIYAVDYIGIREITTPAILTKWNRGKVFAEITAWIVKKVSFYPDIIINQSTLGDHRFIERDSEIQYSRFNAVIEVERDLVSFTIKELLPLVFFVVIAYLLLFLPFEQVSVEAVSGLLLAVVFYHLSLIEKLPDGIGYVVALDYAFYILYALLGLELFLVTVGYSQWLANSQIEIRQLMNFGRFVFPLLLFVSFALLYWQYFYRS